MEPFAVLAGIDLVMAVALVLLAGRAWLRSRDRRAAWLAVALLALLAGAITMAWQAWTQPATTAWTLIAASEGIALATLYVGALR